MSAASSQRQPVARASRPRACRASGKAEEAAQAADARAGRPRHVSVATNASVADRGNARVDDETHVTEISIGPDGRVYVFGLSRPVLEILAALQPADAKLSRLLNHVRQVQPVQQALASGD